MSTTLSRQQRRRLAMSSAAVQRVTDADAKFFARFPWRSHRVRYAARAELEANAAAQGLDRIEMEPGRRWFTVVRQIEPGVRARLFVQNRADADPDMSESEAQGVYEWLARTGSTKALEIEAKIRNFVEQRGGR